MNLSIKNAISAFSLFVLCYYNLSSSPNVLDIKSVKVGRQPLVVKYDIETKKYHVFCMGYDKNFNGEFDVATDERSSWWVISESNGTFTPTKVKDFTQGYLNFPLRMIFLDADDYNPRTTFIPFGNVNNSDFTIKTPGKVVSFDLDNYKEVDANVLGYYVSSVSTYGPHLLVTKNLVAGKAGKVAVFNLSTKSSLQEISAGMNTNNALAFTASDGKLRAIATSDDYSDSSSFFYAEVPHMSDFVFNIKKIGKTVNHISQNKDLVAITCNEGHSVTIFNIVSGKVVNTISTGTTGFNGPREAIFLDDNTISVSTYSGKVSLFDISSGNLITSFTFKAPDDKNESLEGMLYANNKLLVTNPYTNYDSQNSKVYIIDNPLSKSNIEDEDNQIGVYPNPVSDYLYLSSIDKITTIDLIDILGNEIRLNNSQFIDLKPFKLQNRVYFVKISTNMNTYIKKININN
jgi:hypothetical protein